MSPCAFKFSLAPFFRSVQIQSESVKRKNAIRTVGIRTAVALFSHRCRIGLLAFAHLTFALLSHSHCWHSHCWLRTGVVRTSVFRTLVVQALGSIPGGAAQRREFDRNDPDKSEFTKEHGHSAIRTKPSFAGFACNKNIASLGPPK